MSKVIGLRFDEENLKILEKVGQVNNLSVPSVCRLIVLSQLTFYRKTNRLPVFFESVSFNLKENKLLDSEIVSDKSETISDEDYDMLIKSFESEHVDDEVDPDGLPF